MPRSEPGQEPGQGLSWREYVAWLTDAHGSLAAAAQRLAELRGWKEDASSIERALRRLRARGHLDGGTWGARALLAFGLPAGVDARMRWMGAYHSRFTDLPLPLCLDLLRLWDRPPVRDDPSSSTWLAIAHASCALRAGDWRRAAEHLGRASATRAHAAPEAKVELLLVKAFVASRDDPAGVAALLAPVEELLSEIAPGDDRACLHARWIDHRAYEHNHRAEHATAESLYLAIPTTGAPPFARCRRANGLAYARHVSGDRAAAVALAHEACEHAGDGGHLRLRAMALSMLARALGSPEGDAARERALAISRALDDAALRMRFERR